MLSAILGALCRVMGDATEEGASGGEASHGEAGGCQNPGAFVKPAQKIGVQRSRSVLATHERKGV